MKIIKTFFISLALLFALPLHAVDKLVLDINADEDMLALSHNIDKFLFKPTVNFSTELAGNLSDRVLVDALKNHLVISALVRIDGEIAGIATEQEIVIHDPKTGELDVNSAWLFILNHPKASGFLAVKQKEGNKKIFELIQEVMQNPGKEYEDRDQYLLGTTSKPVIALATGGVEVYKGGRFEEYNVVNQADFKNKGRFSAKLRFIIYPPGK